MAKTRVKIIDDSQPEEPKKESKKVEKVEQKVERQGVDTLVESLKAELGEIESKPKKEKVAEASEDISPAESADEEAKTQPEEKEEPKKVIHPKVGKEKPRSKKYKEALKLVDPESKYSLNEAVDLAKKVSYSKYEGTLELHLNSSIKNLRGSVSLPFGSGTTKKILAFGKGAKESGADIVGDDSTLEQISKGKIDFDLIITTPEWMGKLAGLAKVLGPKGLMPNPKNGTITEDLKKAVGENQSGKLEYKTENNGKVIHLSLGKVSQPTEELSQNIKVLLSSIGKSKIKKVTLSPTLGPGVKLDLSSI